MGNRIEHRRRAVRWLPVLLALTCSTAVVAGTAATAEDVRWQVFGLLRDNALYRDRVDWPEAQQALRARLAEEDAQADALLRDLVRRSTGGHGRWIGPEPDHSGASRADGQAAREGNAAASNPQGPDNPEVAPVQDLSQLDARIGWIEVPAFIERPTTDRQQQFQARIAFAAGLQDAVRHKDSAGRCGWVVDLRRNSGGNMWPMLLGLAPLLEDAQADASHLGAFDHADGRQPWAYRDGGVTMAGNPVLGFGQPGYRLRHPGAPVALLVGARTASSGEAVLLAFRGRPQTHSFGQATAGFSSANRTAPLRDGGTLLLTESVMVDRNGAGDGGRLVPDTAVDTGQDPLRAARDWLLAQPACHID